MTLKNINTFSNLPLPHKYFILDLVICVNEITLCIRVICVLLCLRSTVNFFCSDALINQTSNSSLSAETNMSLLLSGFRQSSVGVCFLIRQVI